MTEKNVYCGLDSFHKLSGRQQRRLSMPEYVRYREWLRQYDYECFLYCEKGKNRV